MNKITLSLDLDFVENDGLRLVLKGGPGGLASFMKETVADLTIRSFTVHDNVTHKTHEISVRRLREEVEKE